MECKLEQNFVGNYHGYYNKRNEDQCERLAKFKEEWFRGKVCLDIGCNSGSLTTTIAKEYSPQMIIGVDKDYALIDCARSAIKRIKYDLRKHATSNKASPECIPTIFKPRSVAIKKPATITKVADLENTGKGIEKDDDDNHSNFDEDHYTKSTSNSNLIRSFPDNIAFVIKDAFSISSSSSRYDTILCLSVTKWIHLNYGDERLLDFFRLCFNILKENGLFILEYQPLRSYKKRKNSQLPYYSAIELLPAQFEEVLIDEIGFVVEERQGPRADDDDAKGFDRPILILRKMSKIDQSYDTFENENSEDGNRKRRKS